MEGMNKFKVLMVIVVFMFLFVVAAIYTNTKEASVKKAKEKISTQTSQEAAENNVDTNSVESTDFSANYNSELENINSRLDSLSARIDGVEADMKYTCRVYGVLTDESIEQLSPEAAIREARDNNKEFVMSCSF